jgi:CDP-glucose 4,6-dehydratase
MENMGMSPSFWDGRRVFVTGHTGFKGSWLSLWLCSAGAKVHGFALAPPTEPSLFDVAGVGAGLASHTVGDIRDAEALRRAMAGVQPEIVFHLAAQPLVRRSYVDPVETYAVNVLGSVHLFEAVRACSTVRAVVNVTTDKCYDNQEHARAFRETDALGGRDPYSSSKACAELVTAAYRDSFLAASGVEVATARAGNVIGGGDWAADRLLPDFFRACDHGRTTAVRHPDAVRPWQHVLEPLAGYLLLAQRLVEHGQAAAGAWNFGPTEDDAKPVRWVLDYLAARMPGTRWQAEAGTKVHEAQHLALDSAKARAQLGWTPAWGLATALDRTIEWHDAWRAQRDMRALCLAQIEARQSAAVV